MRLSGGSACIKYLLFIFNLLFVITGIVLLSVGAVIQGVYYNYDHFLDDRYFSAPALLIAVGAIVLIVSFFGCCGAVKENYCMILTFSILLLLVFILELSGGIAGYVLRDSTFTVLTSKLNDTMYMYGKNKEITKVWDTLQTGLDCCGTKNYTDWWDVFHNDSLPLSCCPRVSGMIGYQNCSLLNDTFYNHSCVHELGIFVESHAAVLGGVGIGIAFIQLLGVILACLLARYIRMNYESV